MTRPRTTSGKYQRQEQKRAKARAKTERRDARKSTAAEEATAEAPVGIVDEGLLMDELASLHQSLEAGDVQLPEFEERREHIRTQLERLQ